MKVELIKDIHRCDNNSNWTVSGCSFSTDTNVYYEGKASLRIAGFGINDYGYYSFSSLSIDISLFPYLYFYWKTTSEDTNDIAVRIWEDAGNHSLWYVHVGYADFTKITIDLTNPNEETGSLDFTNINRIYFISTEGLGVGEHWLDYIYRDPIDITSDVLAESYNETEMRNHPKAMIIARGTWIPVKGDIIRIYDYHTSAGSTTADQIIFEGIVDDYEQTWVRKIPCFSRAKRDLDEYRPKENLSGDVDSNHLKTLIGKCAYITEGTIDATVGNTSYELEGDKTFRSVLNDLADKHKKMWALTPTGALNFEDADVDSGEVFFYHKAEYNFKKETVGTSGTDIGYIDVADLSGGTAKIIASLGGHKKVLELHDNNNAEDIELTHNFGSNQEYGVKEFWIRTTAITEKSQANLFSDAAAISWFYIQASKFQYYDGAVKDIPNVGAPVNDTWHHIVWYWECGDGGHYGLGADKMKFVIDEVDSGELAFAFVATTINKIILWSDIANVDYYIYYDAIDFSWASGYSAGRNLKGEIDKVWGVRPTKQVEAINIVLAYGGFGADGRQISASERNTASVEQLGEILFKDTYAMIKAQAELDTVATNLLSREAPTILILSINYWFRYVNKGLYQVGETGWFADMRANPEIAPQEMIFRKIKYFFKKQISYFEVDSGLVFKKKKDKTLPEENSLLIQQKDRFVWRVPEPTANDFLIVNLIDDTAYNDLDLSSIIPVGATSVLMSVWGLDDAASSEIQFRRNGQADIYQLSVIMTQVPNVARRPNLIVGVDSNRKCEIKVNPKPTDWTSIGIIILGWWI